MAHGISTSRRVRRRESAVLPRGLLILLLVVMSWAVVVLAGLGIAQIMHLLS